MGLLIGLRPVWWRVDGRGLDWVRNDGIDWHSSDVIVLGPLASLILEQKSRGGRSV